MTTTTTTTMQLFPLEDSITGEQFYLGTSGFFTSSSPFLPRLPPATAAVTVTCYTGARARCFHGGAFVAKFQDPFSSRRATYKRLIDSE